MRHKFTLATTAFSIGLGFVLGLIAVNAHAADLSTLLNKTNVINYEEVQMAKTATDKAGDNQPLLTFAATLKGDHEANEDAVTALSRQKGVKIDPTPADADDNTKVLEKLDGAAFNAAFLKDEISGHEEALDYLKQAQSEFSGDRDAEIYIEQTIPIVKAHLEMAKGLQQQMAMGSNENPENNKKQ
jgi:putative membrane protein